MAGYTNIRNSTANANSNYFTNAGVAINASNQPTTQDDTVMAGVPDASLGKDMYGFVSKSYPVAYTGNDRTQIIMGISNVLKGVANTAVKEGASPPVAISIPQMNALRSVRTTSAIRSGAWNEVSGIFASSGGPRLYPSTSNDFTAVGNDLTADSLRSAPGYTIYNQGGGLPTTTGYSARTS